MGIKAAYTIRALTHAYDGSVILDIPALDIPEGGIIQLMGPNGSGKTTLLYILALLLTPTSGNISINGIEYRYDPDLALRRTITLVHQKPVLFSTSVRKNLEYGLKARGIASKEIHRRIESIDTILKLSPLLDKHARKLSGGEAQRVILARALILETPVLLLDEPTNSLDDAYRPVLMRLLSTMNRERGTTIIVATHDMNLISSVGGTIFRMERGKILDESKTLEKT